MKILMINKFLYPKGGAETYALKLGGHLEQQGHEVQYFGMDDEKRTVGNRMNAYTRNMDFHGGWNLDKVTYAVRTIYSFEARKKIRLVLEDFQPDVCHLNNFNYQLTPAILLEIENWRKEHQRKCKIIYTAHDYNLICPNHLCRNPITNENCEKCFGGHFGNCVRGKCIHGSLAKSVTGAVEAYFWNWKGAYRYIDKIICCSRFLKNKMDINPVFQKKTVVLHNFTDERLKKTVQKEAYILYFGRYSQEKGLHTLIEVCKELSEIPFVFAGSGPLNLEPGDAENIKNVGFQTGEALENLIRKAAFSICPSECYENCPFSILESLLFGTPVLGADIGGIPELIEVGRTGELFESGNREDLKRKILSLWKHKNYEKYGQNCQTLKFDTITTYCEKLMQIYES